jgi:hypothetical protein
MLIPIGPVKHVPVTLLRVSHEPPLVTGGEIIFFDGKAYQIALHSPDDSFSEGEQVLVDFGEGSSGRRRTRIRSVSPAVIQVELLGRPRRRERREFPRIEGNVPLEFRLLDASERHKMESWLRHPHLGEAGETWQKPDPFMDFSVTGLRFRTRAYIDAGKLMCLRFKLLGSQTWTAGGEVVRTDEEEDGWYSHAVAFTGVTDDVSEALMEYTRHCQDLLLGLDSLHEE